MIPGQSTKEAWVSALDSLNPDLVVNTGDNLSDERAVPDVLRALGPLLNRPGMFVFGTNDYWAPQLPNPFKYLFGIRRIPSYIDLPWRDMRAAFIERGWQDATHQRLEFQVGPVRIAAAGVDDPHHELDDYSLIDGPPNPDADLSLALLHSPEPRVLSEFERDGYRSPPHTHAASCACRVEGAVNCGIDRDRQIRLRADEDTRVRRPRYVEVRAAAPVLPPSATLRITEAGLTWRLRNVNVDYGIQVPRRTSAEHRDMAQVRRASLGRRGAGSNPVIPTTR